MFSLSPRHCLPNAASYSSSSSFLFLLLLNCLPASQAARRPASPPASQAFVLFPVVRTEERLSSSSRQGQSCDAWRRHNRYVEEANPQRGTSGHPFQALASPAPTSSQAQHRDNALSRNGYSRELLLAGKTATIARAAAALLAAAALAVRSTAQTKPCPNPGQRYDDDSQQRPLGMAP